MTLLELGDGSWLWGILLVVFGLIGLINAFAAFMLWYNAFLELLNKKAKSMFGFWFPIFVVTFGWYALFEILKKIF